MREQRLRSPGNAGMLHPYNIWNISVYMLFKKLSEYIEQQISYYKYLLYFTIGFDVYSTLF